KAPRLRIPHPFLTKVLTAAQGSTNIPEDSTTKEDPTTLPDESTTAETQESTTIKNSTPIPVESTTASQNSTNIPKDSTTIEDATTLPDETTTAEPEKSTTTIEASTSIPSGSSTVGQDSTKGTEENTTDSTYKPGESSTIANSTPIPDKSTTVDDTTSSFISSTQETTPSYSSSTSSSPDTTSSTLSPLSCSSGNSYLPHPTNCHKFIQCSNGNEFIMDCPANLYWDYQNLACSREPSVCYNSEENAKPEEKTCGPGVDFLVHPTDCTKYLQCSNGEPLERKCPDPLYWNPEISVCDWSNKYCNNLQSANESISCAVGMNFDVFQGDCSKYIKCFGLRGIVMSCSLGLYWNPVSELCEKSQRFCT
ncbi:hypothetical protein M5D96_006687, partial [Drosophila gunungcola]